MTTDAKELAVRVLAYLDLEREVSRSRDPANGLNSVRTAEAELRKFCREITAVEDGNPTGTLFG